MNTDSAKNLDPGPVGNAGYTGHAAVPTLHCNGRWMVVEVGGTHVFRLGADETSVAELFEAMGGPAKDAADGEGRGEELDGDVEAVEEKGCIELDVGVDA